MSFPKNMRFPAGDQEVGARGRVIGHPARAFILRLLNQKGKLFFHQIVAAVPLTEGTVTAHLRKLRLAGLIEVEEYGLRNAYKLRKEGLMLYYQQQQGFISGLLTERVPDEIEVAERA